MITKFNKHAVCKPAMISKTLMHVGHLLIKNFSTVYLPPPISHVTIMADRLFESIISYMEPRRQYSTAKLAKVVGLREARDVTSTLQELELRGKIQQVPGTPYWEKTHYDRMRGPSPRGRQGRAQDYRNPRQSGRGGSRGGNVSRQVHTAGGSLTGDLRDRLLYVLRANNGVPVTALEMAKQLGFPSRKHVNPTLYALHREGVICMSQDSGAPLWSIGSTPPAASTPQGFNTGVSFGGLCTRKTQCPSSPSEGELARRLVNVLASSREPQTTLQLGQAVGASRSVVTPILRRLGHEGVISALPGNPERWSAKNSLGANPSNPQLNPQQLEPQPQGAVTSHADGREAGSAPLSLDVELSGQGATVPEQMESMSEQIRSVSEQPEQMESTSEHIGSTSEHIGSTSEQWGTTSEQMHSATSQQQSWPIPESPELALPVRSSSVTSEDDDASRQLIALLSASPQQQLTALQLAQKMGARRADINPVLYRMEKRGVVKSVSGSMPPRWYLVPSPSSMAIGTHSGEADLQLEPFEVDMDEEDTGGKASQFAGLLASLPSDDVRGRLLLVLQSDVTMQYTELELACSLGLASRRDVAPHLKTLESDGLVCRTSGSFPVKWGLMATTSRTPLGYPSPYLPGTSNDTSLYLPGTTDTHGSTSAALVPSASTLVVSERIAEDVTRNPISWLTEYCQARKLNLDFAELREYGPPHRRNFVVAAQFAGHSFEAESTSKKEARRMAADLALQTILANQAPYPQPSLHQTPPGTMTEAFDGSVGASIHDRIAHLSHEFYLQLQNSLHSPQPGRKVTACFVMEDASSGRHTPVAVGSGTRCITGDHMSLEGLVVNDSHAEIVARRSLLRFFYAQLRSYYRGVCDTIFRECPDHPPLLEVKEDIRFHLYISTAPCGDGAQFSRGDDQNREPPPVASTTDEGGGGEGEHRPTMSAKTQGVLRTKMEGGEGTIPIGADAPGQTWDGILHGGRLRTMSCSDKVGRWSVVGLQGALLAHFMRPVYLSSLTLGSLHHHGHLSRAVCCRFADLLGLPEGFSVHHPRLGRVRGGDEMKRHTEKASNFSLNWAHGDETGELNDGGNGRPVPTPGALRHSSQLSLPCSRISKASLLGEFVALCRLVERTDLFEGRCYREIKEAAAGFQRAKGALYKLCEQKGYGTWMKKPPEQEQFDATILERLKTNNL